MEHICVKFFKIIGNVYLLLDLVSHVYQSCKEGAEMEENHGWGVMCNTLDLWFL